MRKAAMRNTSSNAGRDWPCGPVVLVGRNFAVQHGLSGVGAMSDLAVARLIDAVKRAYVDLDRIPGLPTPVRAIRALEVADRLRNAVIEAQS